MKHVSDKCTTARNDFVKKKEKTLQKEQEHKDAHKKASCSRKSEEIRLLTDLCCHASEEIVSVNGGGYRMTTPFG